jgi:DNA-binding NarL/FixJ family response regulator
MTDSTTITTRVLVLDSHPVYLDGVAAVLKRDARFEIFATAESVPELVGMVSTARPDVLLVGDATADRMGHESLGRIAGEAEVPVLMLGTSCGEPLHDALKATDAQGCVLRDTSVEELTLALIDVASGKKFFSQPVVEACREFSALEMLTPQERVVLGHAAGGKNSASIALLMGMSMPWVSQQMARTITKLNAKDRTHAVAIAVRRGIITP